MKMAHCGLEVVCLPSLLIHLLIDVSYSFLFLLFFALGSFSACCALSFSQEPFHEKLSLVEIRDQTLANFNLHQLVPHSVPVTESMLSLCVSSFVFYMFVFSHLRAQQIRWSVCVEENCEITKSHPSGSLDGARFLMLVASGGTYRAGVHALQWINKHGCF